jgi:hypothetical protein
MDGTARAAYDSQLEAALADEADGYTGEPLSKWMPALKPRMAKNENPAEDRAVFVVRARVLPPLPLLLVVVVVLLLPLLPLLLPLLPLLLLLLLLLRLLLIAGRDFWVFFSGGKDPLVGAAAGFWRRPEVARDGAAPAAAIADGGVRASTEGGGLRVQGQRGAGARLLFPSAPRFSWGRDGRPRGVPQGCAARKTAAAPRKTRAAGVRSRPP